MAHKARWLKAVLIVVAIVVGGGGGALVYRPPIVYGIRHHLLYVPNGLSNSITVYAASATGNVAPIRTISGASTQLNSPFGVALDVDGTLYVTNANGNSITVYAPGVGGPLGSAAANVAPVRTIGGLNTGLSLPTGVDLDAASNLYVANGNSSSITVYAPGVGGLAGSPAANAMPIRTISGVPGLTQGVVVDDDGTLYVAGFPSLVQPSIFVYAPGASVPSRIILVASSSIPVSSTVAGVTLDASGNLYVATSTFLNGAINVYAPGAGCAPPGCGVTPVTPLRTIGGPGTGLANLPSGVDLDRAGNLYVANIGPSPSITVYAPGVGGPPGSANANVAPIRTISGASTGLNDPQLISLR